MQHIANNTPAKTAFVVARCVSFGAVPVGMLREPLTHAVHADLILLARGPCAAVDVASANYLGRDEPQMYVIADALAGASTKQFPGKFN